MRWGRRQGRSTKIFERITRCCRYLQQPSCAICEWCVLEREKLFIRNWTIDILSSISPPHACRHNEFTQNKKKVPSSSFANGIWHLTHFSLYLSPTWRREMPQQLKDKWWTNMIRNGNYAIANFRILRIFVHVLLHLPCGISLSSSLYRVFGVPVGDFINKMKSLNFMETLVFLDYNHQHQQTRNFHARTKN